MTKDQAEMIVEYYADIRRKMSLIRRQQAELNDEISTLHGMGFDGMPRSNRPGDSTAAMAVKMDELGISEQLHQLDQQAAMLQSDLALIRGKINSLRSVHSEILVKRYVFGYTWVQMRARVSTQKAGQHYSVSHLKRLRNVALVMLAEKLERLPERGALLERAYNARKAARAAGEGTVDAGEGEGVSV